MLSGISMRCSSRLVARGCICGEQSMRKARYSIVWCSRAGTSEPHCEAHSQVSHGPREIRDRQASSYAAARAELPLPIAHERGLRQNNRAESSHVPVRRRERKIQRFRSAGSAQRFLSAHASVYNTFNICHHLITSATKRRFRTEAFETWRAAAGVAV